MASGLVGVGVVLVFSADSSTSLWVLALLGLAASVAAIVLEHLRRCLWGLALAIAATLIDSLLIMAAAFFEGLQAFLDRGGLWFH